MPALQVDIIAAFVLTMSVYRALQCIVNMDMLWNFGR